jgi:hypothetical protein
MSLRLALLCLLCLLSCACAAPQQVMVYVEDFTPVAGCELRGVVRSKNPPNWSQKATAQRLQSETAWLGGNTLMLTEMGFWAATGLAYRCTQP